MNRVKKIQISSNDINELISGLETLSSEIKQMSMDIPLQVAHQGLTYLDKQYANTPDDENITDITTSVGKTTNGYAILSTGYDVLYAEFGTGDKGEQKPHPEKNKYSDLKGYNTGDTIRDVPKGNEWLDKNGIIEGKYWVYMKDGKLIPTQGVPSGRQMFNTSNELRSNIIKKVLDEKGRDAISKV